MRRSMGRKVSVLAAMVGVIAAVGTCWAQVFGMGRGMSVMMLLNFKEVQKELKLKPEQLKAIQEKQKKMGGTGKTVDFSAIQNAMAEMNSVDAMEKKAADILDAEQAKRLHELLIQHEGPAMLAEPSVAEALSLTKEQKERVAEIVAKNDSDRQGIMMEMTKVRSSGGQKAIQKKMADLRKSTDDALIALLTPEQSSKWQSIQGAKFKFPKMPDGS